MRRTHFSIYSDTPSGRGKVGCKSVKFNRSMLEQRRASEPPKLASTQQVVVQPDLSRERHLRFRLPNARVIHPMFFHGFFRGDSSSTNSEQIGNAGSTANLSLGETINGLHAPGVHKVGIITMHQSNHREMFGKLSQISFLIRPGFQSHRVPTT